MEDDGGGGGSGRRWRLIQRAEQLLTAVSGGNTALLYRPDDCSGIPERIEALAGKLRDMAPVHVYTSATRRILAGAARALSLAAVRLTAGSVFRRRFEPALSGASAVLDQSIKDIAWLLKISAPSTSCSRTELRRFCASPLHFWIFRIKGKSIS